MYTVDMISKKYSAQGSTPSKTWIFATEKICLTSRGFDLNLCTVDSTKKKKFPSNLLCLQPLGIKQDKDRRKGKGRRVCLTIYSIPCRLCRASCFA